MASDSALYAGTIAVRALLAANTAFMTAIGSRLYPNTNGDPPDGGGAQPYASIESAGETPYNTMGATADAKWGSIATIHLRLSSLSRSEAEIQQIAGLAKAALEGQDVTVSGYGSASLEFAGLTPLLDTVGGRKVREWILAFELTAHQGAR